MAAVNNTPGTLNITLYRGDTYYFIATVKDNGGNSLNLTGFNIKAEIYGPNFQPLIFSNEGVVTQRQRNSNVATLTLSEPHNFDIGQTITVSNVGAGYNGTRVVTDSEGNTISYGSTGTNESQGNVDPVGSVISSVKAEFQVGNKASELNEGKIHLFLPDGVSRRLPDNSVYDIEISRLQNLTDLGDDPTDDFDDHWTVQTILRGEIDMIDDITYSVSDANTSSRGSRGQLT
jgi:hypothetical protein